ncbi:GNAT family N-acetyltransferase [Reinekea thalattae]|uniref:GNAT family N-acetyltransferase n=1 Tax=Reinekea thalattae TaxID=2593301 RepID=A0A5C8Z9P2_9GAMM|nr:GNAT family N-acetyltransferase [Reinekea thalattae]TXR54467.1 GNAT family N-acetyltransferase [Reinekea thalattae]
MTLSLKLETDRLTLVGINDVNVSSLEHYYLDNYSHLVSSGGFTPKTRNDVEAVYQQWYENIYNEEEVRFFIFLQQQLIGVCGLSNIIRGAFHAAYLGYHLSAEQQNKGYMTEAVTEVVQFGFYGLNLHRIMANFRPDNLASGRVLEKVGFIKEGYAKDYLMVDGIWQDHILTALTNAHWVKRT